jgi:hypothetical protein
LLFNQGEAGLDTLLVERITVGDPDALPSRLLFGLSVRIS